jgi:hypothetical protein
VSICKFGTLSLIGLKYWVKEELIRFDVRQGQAGIEIVLDGQFVDVETREPIVGLYWDIWNCNSTGVIFRGRC